MCSHGRSQRRACQLVGVNPKPVRHEPDPDNPEIRARMHEIGGKRRCFGCRRIGLMRKREGMKMKHKQLRRLYQEEGRAVRRRRDRKRET